MKTAWLFNHYAQEPSGSGGTRHFSLAKHIRDQGWDIKVIAASVDHFDGRQRISDRKTFRCDDVDGVSFIWLKTPEYKGNGLLRVLNMLVYTMRAYFGSWKKAVEKPDVIIGSSVHPFAAIAAALLARKYVVPFVFEVRDLWPETLVAMGMWSKASWKTKFFRNLEKWLYNRASKIVVLLPYADEYIVSMGVSKDKVSWIPNGVELNHSPQFLTTEHRDAFDLMYLGSHGQANGLDVLLEAMAILQNEYPDNHVKLRMIGNGVEKVRLMEQAKAYSLKNVVFEDAVNKSEVPNLAAQASAFVICVRDLPDLYRYGISMNKIYDYMAAARPIVIASNARNNPVQDAGCGISVLAENSELLAKAIYELSLLSVRELNRLGRNGRHFVEKNFDYQVLAEDFSKVLDEALKDR